MHDDNEEPEWQEVRFYLNTNDGTLVDEDYEPLSLHGAPTRPLLELLSSKRDPYGTPYKVPAELLNLDDDFDPPRYSPRAPFNPLRSNYPINLPKYHGTKFGNDLTVKAWEIFRPL